MLSQRRRQEIKALPAHGQSLGLEFAFDQDAEDILLVLTFHQLIAAGAAVRFEILPRARIGRKNLQRCSRRQILKRSPGSQNRDWAVQTSQIEHLIGHDLRSSPLDAAKQRSDCAGMSQSHLVTQ
jgi:hypothetical protein